jgi:cell wall-associated NlpC family hydrolase
VPAPLARHRSLRTLAVAAIALSATLLAGLAPTAVYAAPTTQQAQAQIDSLWNKLEPLVEQYNGVHIQLQQNKAKQAALDRTLRPLQIQVSLAETRAGALSAKLYMSGSGSNVNALLQSGSPSAFADQLATLDHMARVQQESIATVATEVAAYNKKKEPLDRLVNQQKQQDAELATQKTKITGQMASLQKLIQQSGGGDSNYQPVACPQIYPGGPAGKAVEKACSLIGKPYGWADAGPTYYDCSGLTMVAWEAGGKYLEHFTGDQREETKYVSRADLRPGDLIFFGSPIHHVGIFVGNGWMVHAPHTGDHVRMAKIDSVGTPNSYGRP